jgi:serine-threonine kinase receptor-associated protein
LVYLLAEQINKYYRCSPITPDGVFLTSASKDGSPQLRDGATGDWIGTFQGHKGAVWACVLNDPAFVAATASADFSARVWNAVTGDEVHCFAHKHIVRTVAFERGNTGTRLVTGGAEKLVRLYDLCRPEAEPVVFNIDVDRIRKCMWTRDNRGVLVSYLDRPGVDLLDLASGNVVMSVPGSGNGPMSSMELTYDQEYLVTAESDTVSVWGAGTLGLLKQQKIEDFEVEAASYFPQKKRLVAGGSDMWVHVYDFESGKLIENGRGHHGPVHCIRFAPDGETFASGSEDGTIRLWATNSE